MIAIVDYGAGNIFSVKNALDFLNLPSKLQQIQKKSVTQMQLFFLELVHFQMLCTC